MEYVYVVVENGVAYPAAYTTYDLAVSAVKTKHKEEIELQEKEAAEAGVAMETEVDVPEHASGQTQLYIEKGINILISKLPIKSTVKGGKRSKKRTTRRRDTR